MCTIDDPLLGRLLRRLAALVSPNDLIWSGGDAAYRAFFLRASALLKVSSTEYRPYSLRRGGATHDFLCFKNLQRTILRGRWSDLKVARIYINDGLSVQTQVLLSAPSQALISFYGGIFHRFLVR